MRILLTGGAGFIGSHTLVLLLQAGHQVLVVDNHVNSNPVVYDRVRLISNTPFDTLSGDLRDTDSIAARIRAFDPEAVVHFAGLKAVGESVADPVGYFDNNVGGTIALLRVLAETGCRRFVFSSSATVYGEPKFLPYTEDHPRDAMNPYGRTKQHVEDLLEATAAGDPHWSVASLRYFNPVGAHDSGQIGEDPNGVPNNLMPYVAQVAVGRRAALPVFGDDYDTRDGTGERDYIHVVDLAEAHLAALDWTTQQSGYRAFNIGTGQSVTVWELVAAFEAASGRKVNAKVEPRRPGDLPAYWAGTARAEQELNWRASRGIDEICQSQWRWQSQNPDGYGS